MFFFLSFFLLFVSGSLRLDLFSDLFLFWLTRENYFYTDLFFFSSLFLSNVNIYIYNSCIWLLFHPYTAYSRRKSHQNQCSVSNEYSFFSFCVYNTHFLLFFFIFLLFSFCNSKSCLLFFFSFKLNQSIVNRRQQWST